MIKLDPRLQLVADMVDKNCRLADIGTDHAYLPVYLLENNLIPSAIAADLRSGPLSHAEETVRVAGLEKQIELRLSDGLDKFQAEEIDCVVMAGMGGILITQIIDRAHWLCTDTKTLVLQPMTDAPLLRTYLAEHGFAIIAERAIGDAKHIYTVIKAKYCSKPFRPTALQALVGLLNQPLGEFEKRYLKKERASLSKQMNGLAVAGKDNEVEEIAKLYNELTNLLGEESL